MALSFLQMANTQASLLSLTWQVKKGDTCEMQALHLLLVLRQGKVGNASTFPAADVMRSTLVITSRATTVKLLTPSLCNVSSMVLGLRYLCC